MTTLWFRWVRRRWAGVGAAAFRWGLGAVLATAWCGAAVGGSGATLSIGFARGQAGTTVHVPATLTTAGNDIATILVSIAYDTTVVEVVDVAAGETVDEANKTLDFGVSRPGTLRVLVYGGVTTLDDGALFAMGFRIRSGASNTVTALRASEASAANPGGAPVGFTVGEGQIAVGSSAVVTVTPNPGEVGAGEVLSLDAQSTDLLDVSFIWTTDNPDIAIVSITGRVRGVNAGTASIAARGLNSGVTGRAAVRVVYSALVSVAPNPAVVEVGNVVALTATSESQDDTAFTWESTDEDIASVMATGDAAAEAAGNTAGTVYIAARGDESGLQGATQIVVTEEPMVLVTPNQVSLFPGQSAALTASSSDASDTYFIWETSDGAVASVSADGVVTGLLDGTAAVTATGGISGLVGEAAVEVACAALSSPANVRASDGEYDNGVLVQWDVVSAASVEYRVYRCDRNNSERAEPLGEDWQSEAEFFDDTADPPLVIGAGCYELPFWIPKRYYYWVAVRSGSDCVSELGSGDEGYRGNGGTVWTAGMTEGARGGPMGGVPPWLASARASRGDILFWASAAAALAVLGRRRPRPARASC